MLSTRARQRDVVATISALLPSSSLIHLLPPLPPFNKYQQCRRLLTARSKYGTARRSPPNFLPAQNATRSAESPHHHTTPHHTTSCRHQSVPSRTRTYTASKRSQHHVPVATHPCCTARLRGRVPRHAKPSARIRHLVAAAASLGRIRLAPSQNAGRRPRCGLRCAQGHERARPGHR